MFPLVSIIVPVYNAERFLGDCVESLINQTYSNIEVFIVDDGSRDGSLNLANRYAFDDPRIRVIHKKNEGVSSARNVGINCCNGDYISFVDADDIVSKTFIEDAISTAIQSNADLVIGNTLYIREHVGHEDNDRIMNSEMHYHETCSNKQYIIEDVSVLIRKILGNGKEKGSPLNGVFTSGPVCKVFKTSLIGTHQFDRNLTIGEDTVFNLEVISNASRCVYVDSNWYYYRLNEDSVTQHFNPHIVEQSTALLKRLISLEIINDNNLSIYLKERMLQQFTFLLSLYILHTANNLTLDQSINLIDRILRNETWDSIIKLPARKQLPGNIFDKVLYRLCKLHAPSAIYLWSSLRVILLNIRKYWKHEN